MLLWLRSDVAISAAKAGASGAVHAAAKAARFSAATMALRSFVASFLPASPPHSARATAFGVGLPLSSRSGPACSSWRAKKAKARLTFSGHHLPVLMILRASRTVIGSKPSPLSPCSCQSRPSFSSAIAPFDAVKSMSVIERRSEFWPHSLSVPQIAETPSSSTKVTKPPVKHASGSCSTRRLFSVMTMPQWLALALTTRPGPIAKPLSPHHVWTVPSLNRETLNSSACTAGGTAPARGNSGPSAIVATAGTIGSGMYTAARSVSHGGTLSNSR